MNNTRITLKNITTSLLAQMGTFGLQFVNRTIFAYYLGAELLGYQSLFVNVFSLLSVAELGISNVISYQLYKEIANDNKSEIRKLMTMYKQIYRFVAIVVFILGCVCYFFVPYIVNNNTLSSKDIFIIYFMQLGSVVIGYFWSYTRIIYIVYQQEYKCIKIDLFITCIIQTIQLLTLWIFRNYYLYLCFQFSTVIISNIIIHHNARKDYPYLKEGYKLSVLDYRNRSMPSDVKNMIIHKISYAIYNGTDNIIISSFCGVSYVTYFVNYIMIKNGIMQIFLNKLLNPVQATLGNIIYSDRSKEKLWNQFNALEILGYILSSYVCLFLFLFYQTIIRLWMGKSYVLSNSFMISLVITVYMCFVWEIVFKYRSVFGEYEYDRKYMIISPIINVIFSMVLVRKWSLVGVQIGTIIGLLPITYGRIRFVVEHYFDQSIYRYYIKHIKMFFIFAMECVAIRVALKYCGGYWGIIVQIAGLLLLPIIGTIITFANDNALLEAVEYIKRILFIVIDRKERLNSKNKS